MGMLRCVKCICVDGTDIYLSIRLGKKTDTNILIMIV